MAEIHEIPAQEENEALRIVFNKPFKWEDAEYTEVDLSGLENLTAMDLESAYRQYAASAGLEIAAIPELSMEYACILAAKATNMPVEFFKALPAKYALALRGAVRSYFFVQD